MGEPDDGGEVQTEGQMTTPQQLGLPVTAWREPHQWPSIPMLSEHPMQTMIVQAPTGSGKSLLAMGLMKYEGSKGFVMTATKSLQQQYMGSAPPDTRMIQGRGNYQCILPEEDSYQAGLLGVKRGATAAEAPCTEGFPCPLVSRCPYYVARDAALKAQISVHNYAYWLPESTYVGGFTGAQWVVADEGHLLDKTLCDFVTIKVTATVIARVGERVPDYADREKLAAWQAWAAKALPGVEKQLVRYPAFSVEQVPWLRARRQLRALVALDSPERVMLDYHQVGGLTLKPVWPSDSLAILLGADGKKGKRLLIMSATILDVGLFTEVLGIQNYGFLDLPYVFPAANRPLFYRPAAKVTQKTRDQAAPALGRAVDYILDKNVGRKGLVHTNSFKLAELIALNSQRYERLLVHTPFSSRGELLAKFRASKEDVWLVSPSIGHGEDFPYDAARCQIIAKIPYPDLSDRVVRIRANQNPSWYKYATFQELWQMYGRVVRAEDDEGDTWVIDEGFAELVERNKRFVPGGIEEAIVWQ